MTRVVVVGDDLARFRERARRLLAAGVPPADVSFVDDERDAADLFAAPLDEAAEGAAARVPRSFVALAERVACHRDPGRWALLYRVLWRVARGEPALLDTPTDPDVRRLHRLDAAVRRDLHKMHAFVRFVRHERDDGAHYVAWHGCEHRVLRAAAPFFVERFGSMRWWILTPFDGAHWDRARLTFGPGVPRRDAALDRDAFDALWQCYYASTFNPARVNPRAMRKEMPRKHWATLPEAALVTDLLLGSPARAAAMVAAGPAGARRHVPAGERRLPVLREAAARCDGCELCVPGTQTVWGEGAPDAPLMLVGEQPGDLEDLAGRPFVGPAGAVLDEALRRAGVARDRLYLTNAVKHFRHEPRGKKRLHATPRARDVAACKPWLDAEVEAVRPRVIVALGATAGRALLGPLGAGRAMGAWFAGAGGASRGTLTTWHPAAVLRAPDAEAQGRLGELAAHLARAWALAAG